MFVDGVPSLAPIAFSLWFGSALSSEICSATSRFSFETPVSRRKCYIYSFSSVALQSISASSLVLLPRAARVSEPLACSCLCFSALVNVIWFLRLGCKERGLPIPSWIGILNACWSPDLIIAPSTIPWLVVWPRDWASCKVLKLGSWSAGRKTGLPLASSINVP